MKASIILPTFDRDEMLGDALCDIRDQVPDRHAHEIIIIDDGPGNLTTQALATRYAAHYIWTHREQLDWNQAGHRDMPIEINGDIYRSKHGTIYRNQANTGVARRL